MLFLWSANSLSITVSIQQIQEEERQLQEAIEKSKQDAEASGLSQPMSPTFQGRVSPYIASVDQESDTFLDVSKVVWSKLVSTRFFSITYRL